MTKINRTGALAALALAAIPAALLAQPTPGQGAPANLTKADAQARAAEMFAKMDANKDGTVTIEERQAARAKMRDHMKAMRGAGDKAGHEGHEGH